MEHKKAKEKELNNRRLGALCGLNPYSPVFHTQKDRQDKGKEGKPLSSTGKVTPCLPSDKEEFNLSNRIQDSSEFKGTWLWSKDVKDFIEKTKKINKEGYGSLLSSILLWFLSDGIKIDEDRLKRLFKMYLKINLKQIDKVSGEKFR